MSKIGDDISRSQGSRGQAPERAYLADVLNSLVNLWPNDRLDQLLPWTWAAAHQRAQLAA